MVGMRITTLMLCRPTFLDVHLLRADEFLRAVVIAEGNLGRRSPPGSIQDRWPHQKDLGTSAPSPAVVIQPDREDS